MPIQTTDAAFTPVAGAHAAREGDIREFAAGSGVAIIGRTTGRGIRLLVEMTLARLLGPAMYAIYAIGWTSTRILGLLTSLGLEQAVIRYGARHWRENGPALKGVFHQTLVYAFLSGLAMGAGFYLTAPWLSTQVFHSPAVTQVIRWFAFAVPLTAGLKVAAAATRVSKRMRFSVSAEDSSQPAAHLVLFPAFFWLGQRLLGAVAEGVLSFAASLILALVYLKRLFPEATERKVAPEFMGSESFAFSLPASLAGTLTMG